MDPEAINGHLLLVLVDQRLNLSCHMLYRLGGRARDQSFLFIVSPNYSALHDSATAFARSCVRFGWILLRSLWTFSNVDLSWPQFEFYFLCLGIVWLTSFLKK